MAGCEDLIRDLLTFGGFGPAPGEPPTSKQRANRQTDVVIALVASGLQPVSLMNLPLDEGRGGLDQLFGLCRKLLAPYGVKLLRPKGGLRLDCTCGLGDACWLRDPHDDARLAGLLAVRAVPVDGTVTAFPIDSPADDLLWSDEPQDAYAQEMLIRLLLPLAQAHPDGAELAKWLRLSDPRTVVAVGLEGGGETMRFVYELVRSHPEIGPDGAPLAGPGGRREFPGGADVAAVGSHLAARRAFNELARVRSEEHLDVGRRPSQANRRKRVELVVVAALAAVHDDNLDDVTDAVRDVMRDTNQRGWVLVLNDNLPALLPDALAGVGAPAAAFGRGADALVARRTDVAVKIGAGTVLHALGVEPGVVRLGGAEHLFSDRGGGYDVAVRAFRGCVEYLQGVAFRPKADGEAEWDELAAEAAKFVGVDVGGWRSLERWDGGTDEQPRLSHDERRTILRGLSRASVSWSRDPAMKRRISLFATVVCKLADYGNGPATAVVRAAAKEIGDLIEAAVRARDEADPRCGGSVVVVSGKIPTRCRTYHEAIRTRLATIAGSEAHPIAVHFAPDTTTCALNAAKWLHRQLRAGAPLGRDVLLESRLIRVDKIPLRGGALASI